MPWSITPCSCVTSNVTYNVTPSDPCPDCLKIASAVVACNDSVGPCGAAGQVDLGALNDVTACDNGSPCSVTYSIISYDTVSFDSVTINATTGVLDFTTSNNAVPNSFGEVRYQVLCDCDPLLSGQGNLRICIKNLCFGVNCAEGEECNPCDGTCDPIVPDVEIS